MSVGIHANYPDARIVETLVSMAKSTRVMLNRAIADLNLFAGQAT